MVSVFNYRIILIHLNLFDQLQTYQKFRQNLLYNYEARTRPDPNRVRVGHVSETDTCPTRVEHGSAVFDTDQPVSAKWAVFNPVRTRTRHCEVGSGPGSGRIKKFESFL